MNHCRCSAIVLGTMDFRETDRIATLLTRDQGKIRGIAKGAKRSVRRFGGALELFARIDLELTPTETLSRLLSADVVSIFPGIRRDLSKIALAGYACELLDTLTPEGVPYPRLFRLLAAYLEHLDSAPATMADRRFFEINLMNILGYRPPLGNCSRCGDAFAGTNPLTVDRTGALHCCHCGSGGRPVAATTVALLEQAMATGRFGAVRFDADTACEAGYILDNLIASHLHRPLKSLSFLLETGEQIS